MAGCGDVGWLLGVAVEGPGVEGFECEEACGLPDTLRRCVCMGVATAFDCGGGVPATVCRIVMDL
jgi:hypothetical protein